MELRMSRPAIWIHTWYLTLEMLRYRRSYTRGNFIWNLWNEPSAHFINFIRNAHKCKILIIIWPSIMKFIAFKILFIIWPIKLGFIAFKMNIILITKGTVDTNAVNDITHTLQNVITCGHTILTRHYPLHNRNVIWYRQFPVGTSKNGTVTFHGTPLWQSPPNGQFHCWTNVDYHYGRLNYKTARDK